MTIQLLTISLGLFVGLALGALGGGGSTLAVPVLVFVAGFEAKDATTASLLVIGLAAAIGAVGHYRNGNVRLRTGVAFGAAGIVGSRLGTLLNQSLPEQILLASFAGLILFVAMRMYRSVQSIPARADHAVPEDRPTSDRSGPQGSTMLLTAPSTTADTSVLSPQAALKLVGAATAVGVLTGLFGVGGGFAVVPALTLLLGFGAKEAVGTSLIVIAINASMALWMRGGDIAVDWNVVAPFLITVTLGVLVGSQVSDRIDADRLTRSFAIMLGAVAAYTAFNAFS